MDVVKIGSDGVEVMLSVGDDGCHVSIGHPNAGSIDLNDLVADVHVAAVEVLDE